MTRAEEFLKAAKAWRDGVIRVEPVSGLGAGDEEFVTKGPGRKPKKRWVEAQEPKYRGVAGRALHRAAKRVDLEGPMADLAAVVGHSTAISMLRPKDGNRVRGYGFSEA